MLKNLINKFPYSKESTTIAIFNIILIVFIILLRDTLPPVVPLYYGFPNGSEELAPRLALTIPAIISVVITIINAILIYFNNNEFVSKILIGTSIVVSLLSTVTTIRIFMLVSSI